MQQSTWATLGKFLVGALTVAVAVVGLWNFFSAPKANLLAEIRPVALVAPFLDEEIYDLREREPGLYSRLKLLNSSGGFATVTISNHGDIPINDVHIVADGALFYGENLDSGSGARILPYDKDGIVLQRLLQGSKKTIYIWMRSGYFTWSTIEGDFSVSYENGVATRKFYLEASPFAGFLDRYFFLIVPALIAAATILVFVLATLRSPARSPSLSPEPSKEETKKE